MWRNLIGALLFGLGAGSVLYGSSFVEGVPLIPSVATADVRFAGAMLVAGGVLAAVGMGFIVFPRERRK